MKKLILGTIGLIYMISAAYFTVGSQTVLELALWCLFFTVCLIFLRAYEKKEYHSMSFKEALSDNLEFYVGGGIFCFVGLYFSLFQGYY